MEVGVVTTLRTRMSGLSVETEAPTRLVPASEILTVAAAAMPNSTISLIEQGVGLQDFPSSSALYDYKTLAPIVRQCTRRELLQFVEERVGAASALPTSRGGALRHR